MNKQVILDLQEAKYAVRVTKASLDPKTAPRFNKEDLEAERARVNAGLDKALEFLKLAQEYMLQQEGSPA